MGDRMLHEEAYPASILDFPALISRIAGMTACHCKQVLHSDFLQEFRRIFRTMLREDVHEFLIDAEFAF